MEEITYRVLSQATGLTISKLKRCALELYQEEEKKSGGRGLWRSFSLDRGFQLCLLALLVDGYRLKIEDAAELARKLFQAIAPVLGNDLLVPEDQPALRQSFLPSTWFENSGEIPNTDLEILPDRFIFRTFRQRRMVQKDEIVSRYTERGVPFDEIAGIEELEPETMLGPIYNLPITAILKRYIEIIRTLV
jgi:hypothetical protein